MALSDDDVPIGNNVGNIIVTIKIGQVNRFFQKIDRFKAFS